MVAGTYLFTALAAIWPLALSLSTDVPIGGERVATVPLFDLWALWWTSDRAGHGFTDYWNAPIFYPNTGVTTYSEPLPFLGLIVTPLWGAEMPPALVYNVALLTTLVLNGVFAYRLARSLEVPPAPALLGGVLMVTLPFVSKIQGVLPNMALFGMLWILEALVRFGRDGATRWAVWAVAGFIGTYLTMQQYAYFFAPFTIAAGVVALSRQRFAAGAAIRLAGAGVMAGLLVILLSMPAVTVHNELGFQRSERVVQALSAHLGDYLTRTESALVPIPPPGSGDSAGLFPGMLLMALALCGVVFGVRDPGKRAWVVYLVTSAIAACLLSLGLNLSFAGWRPFETLRAITPGMDEVRAPFRLAIITQLCLASLAALALGRLLYILVRKYAGLVLLIGLLAAAENLAVPAPLIALPSTPQTAWSTWLRSQPNGTVVAHVPFPSGLHVSDYEIEGWRMFAQIHHRKPLINGYSSYFPQTRAPNGTVIPTYTEFQLAMANLFPSYGLLCTLSRGLGADVLVADKNWLSSHSSDMEAYSTFLQPAFADEQVQIYRLEVPAGECESA